MITASVLKRVNFIWLEAVGKTCGLRRRNETMTDTFRKTKDCRQHALVNYAKSALKVGSLLVAVRLLKVQRLE